jgi:RNA polymerase sigma-70 factor (ECF subfamily)
VIPYNECVSVDGGVQEGVVVIMEALPPDTDLSLLLAGACRGEAGARDLLLQYCEPLILSRVKGRLTLQQFRAEGEDILQSIRCSIVRSLPSLRSDKVPSFLSWLEKLVGCRLSDWERAGRGANKPNGKVPVSLDAEGVPEPAAPGTTPSRQLISEEERARLRKAVEKVPERYRPSLLLICERDPGLPEVARFLGKSPEAARKFLDRALLHLKKAIGPLKTTAFHRFQ